jgi:hypothetical protein
MNGNDVFSRLTFQSNTLHKDTLTLSPGCYSVVLEDTDQDGLYFFANNDGSGSFQIRKLTGAPLKGFDPDFGDKIVHYFTVGYSLGIEDEQIFDFKCYPNPVENQINLKTSGFVDDLVIRIYDNIGKVVFKENWNNNNFNGEKTLPFTGFEHGVYFINVSSKHHNKTKQFIH